MVRHNKRKSSVLVLLIIIGIVSFSLSSSALVKPIEYYNNISWTWSYDAPAGNNYNCLGYATGKMRWEWQSSWGNAATNYQVDSYLGVRDLITKKCWYPLNGQPYKIDIIAYGKPNKIVHFSKYTSTNKCTAKWGSLERFKHNSLDPYYANSVYGKAVRYYYCDKR